ncbi:MAG: helix-turn-helix transcriptional regulator [Pseudomonadota bacterium]
MSAAAEPQFLETILLAMTLGVAVISCGLILRGCVEQKAWPTHAVALTAFFAIILMEAAERLNQAAPPALQLWWLKGTTLLLVPSLGAVVWFYVRGISTANLRFQWRDLWHAGPILVCILGALPFLSLPKERQDALMQGGLALQEPDLMISVVFLLMSWVAWLAILILYGGACLNRLIKHNRNVRDLYSKLDGVSLTWLKVLMIMVVGFFFAAIASALVPATEGGLAVSPLMIAGFYLFVVLVVSMFGVLQKVIVPEWNELFLEPSQKQRYARSALQAADLLRIAQKLDARMQQDRLWRAPDLSLNDVSQATGVSQNNVSQTLNEHLGKNFYDYVNGWRVAAACEALMQTDQTVLSISEDVGFHSKSTFNAAFKKVTGQTPRQYRTENGQIAHQK